MTTESSNVRPTESSALARANGRDVKTGGGTYRPALDVYDLSDRYEIHVDLPGVAAEQVQVTAFDGVLTIEAPAAERRPEGAAHVHTEYGVGDFRRRVRIGEDIDTEGITAQHAHGVLTLVLPKTSKQQPRRIEVGVA